MAISKVIFKESANATPVTWMDATPATAAAEDITAPKTAMLADGEMTTGTGSGGGGSEEEVDLKDVVFVDYDGTIVENYTKAEFLALNAMPSNPTHNGLTAQGWNWTLSDAKDYVTANGILVVGQNYTTSDGKTKFYLRITEPFIGKTLRVCLVTTEKGGVTIDWGDGASTVTTANANSDGEYTHSYSSIGDYVVSLTVTSGTCILGGTGINKALFGGATNGNPVQIAVQKAEIGNGVTGSNTRGCFINLLSLASVSIPVTFLTFGGSGSANFSDNTKIRCIVIPPNASKSNGYFANNSPYLEFISFPKVFTQTTSTYLIADANSYWLRMASLPALTELPSNLLYKSQRMTKASIPGTYTAIASNYTRNCYSLVEVTIPATVTSIGASALADMACMKRIHMLPTAPPALANSNAFSNLPTDCIIYVPTGSLSAYTSATNYPSSSTYTYMEE